MAWPLDMKALNAGEVQLGFGLGVPAPAILEVVHEDWDWFFIDGQHGQLSYDALLHAVRTADSVRTPSLVRVRDHSIGSIGPVLDMDCTGIIVPMVNTAEQARQVVDRSKFPPQGSRSLANHRMFEVPGEGKRTITDDGLLIVQIETEQAVDNVEAIAQTPGVDGIFLGPADLSMSLGLSYNTPLTEPILAERLTRITEAARAAGIIAGCWGSMEPQTTVMLADIGYSLITATNDRLLLGAASATLSQDLRNALG